MILIKFKFRRTVMRNNFTRLFGGVGKRRTVHVRKWNLVTRRFKMQKIRRAHQGHRNKIFGSIQALKIRLQYGRRPTTPQFRR